MTNKTTQKNISKMSTGKLIKFVRALSEDAERLESTPKQVLTDIWAELNKRGLVNPT